MTARDGQGRTLPRRGPLRMIPAERDGRPTEAGIRRMVETFYARAREDPGLGPIFAARIGSAWDPHLDRMVDFWSSVLLASGRYRGNPIHAHRRIPGLEPAHFDRWLELFREVVEEMFSTHVAADVHGRARRMRVVLERNLERPGSARKVGSARD